MKPLEQLKYFFKSGDEQASEDSTTSLQASPLTPGQQKVNQSLLHDSFRYVQDLRGENGSPRLLEKAPGERVVIKTYGTSVDPLQETVIEHTDRLDLLREEVAAFLMSVYFPLLCLPTTTLRLTSQNELKEWGIPQTYSSDDPHNPSTPSLVMLQHFIEGASTYATFQTPLPEIASPRDIFGLLVFDYLIAYGDGRFGNLLIGENTLWGIDHGGSFRSRGIIRGTETLGIPDEYQLGEKDVSNLKADLDPEQAKRVVVHVEKLLGRKKILAFADRFAKIQALLKDKTALTVGQLKQALI